MKKALLLALSILFICSCLCLTVSAEEGYVWPMIGYDFGRGFTWENGSGHNGIDITNTPTGDPIYAVMSGEVVCASTSTPGKTDRCSNCKLEAGYHILIKQTDGLYAVYAHLSDTLVKKGDTVTAGQKIGKIGNTGNSTGPHLHLSLFNQTDTGWFNLYSPVDPLTKITPFCKTYVEGITNTNAKIYGTLGSLNFTMDKGGVYIGTSPDNMTKITENINSGEFHPYTGINYDLNKWGVTLKEGTTYYYQLWISRYGKEYKSNIKTFTTTGCEHTPTVDYKEASCTTEGKIVGKCLWCGEILHESTIPAKGHTFDDGVVTKNPTATSTGIKTYKCENCKTTKEEIIPVIEASNELHTHTLGAWTVEKEATCMEEGKKVQRCTECSEVVATEIIAKINHRFDNGVVIKEATATEVGKKLYTCEICAFAKVEDIPVDTSETVIESPFTDVPKTQWYYSTIITVYQNKLMMGNSLTTFNPTGTMTLAEAITIATRIHHKNATGQDLNVLGGANWYDAYVNYAIEKGIIKDTDFTSYSRPATRGEMAYIFSRCVSKDDLVEINDNIVVPDVYDDYKYADEIKALYKSGVVAGSDEIGRYYPERNISRAEVAMIVARLTNLVNRVQK